LEGTLLICKLEYFIERGSIMNMKQRIGSIGALALAILSQSAWAGCDADAAASSEFITNNPYQLSGLGYLGCEALSMTRVRSFTYKASDNVVTEVSAKEQFDAVILFPRKGKRCSYNFIPGVTSDTDIQLTTPDDSPTRWKGGVIGCTDGIDGTLPLPEPEPPLSTAQGRCAASILVPPASDPRIDCTVDPESCVNKPFIVATAYTEDGAAVCTGFAGSQAEFGQRECLNECATQAASGDCTPNADGSLPLSCSACAPSDGTTLKACWEWTDKVCRDIAGYDNHADCLAPSSTRIDETFIPSQTKEHPAPGLSIQSGSTCYVQIIRFFGRVYAYTSCTGKFVNLGPIPKT
jgi:hypothetical protein